MAHTPQDVRNGENPTDFGANDWLIDEMREQFLADPASVDPVWVEYFTSHSNGTGPEPAPVAAPPAAPAATADSSPAPRTAPAAPSPTAPAAPAPAAGRRVSAAASAARASRSESRERERMSFETDVARGRSPT